MCRSSILTLWILPLLCSFCLVASTKAAKIALDNIASGDAWQGNPLSINNFAIGPGNNRLLVVAVAGEAYAEVTSVTYGGAPLTLIPGAVADSTPSRSELWYLLNPAVGTANIQINLSDTPRGIVFGAMSAFNVSQQPAEVSAGTTGNSTSLTTLTDYTWVFDTANRASQGPLTPSPAGLPFGMIEHWDRQGGSAGNNVTSSAASTRLVPTAGMITNTWSPADTHVLAAFAPVPSLRWNDPAGYFYSASTKWDVDLGTPAAANRVPEIFDEAVFDLNTGPSGYTLTFDNNHINSQLIVRNDTVILDLAGFTYTLSEPNQNDRLDTTEVILGENLGETAVLTVVNGTLNVPHISSLISIGEDGEGTLNVPTGGMVDVSGTLRVGGTGGTLNLDGGNITTGVFEVMKPEDFNWSTGTLTISNSTLYIDNTSVSAPLGNDVAIQTGQSLVVDVFGIPRDLVIGQDGVGNLDVVAGGTVAVGELVIGENLLSDGSLLLTGANSQVTVESPPTGPPIGTIIGENGNADVVIKGGGMLQSWHDAAIASEFPSVANVTVGDPGDLLQSSWQVGDPLSPGNESLYVGGSDQGPGGTGTLTVLPEGSVHVNDLLFIYPGSGTVVLEGGTITTSRLWNQDGECGTGGSCAFQWGSGTLAISTPVIVGPDFFNSSPFGQNLIIDSGRILEAGTVLELGDATAPGFLTVGSDGIVSVEDLLSISAKLGSSGSTLTVSGVTATLSANDIYIGHQASGSLVIENGGIVTVDHDVVVAFAVGSAATVRGSGSQLNVTSDIVVGGFAGGQLTIQQGGVVNATRGGADGSTVVVTDANSSWNLADLLQLTSANGPSFLLIQNNGLVSVGQDFSIFSGGTASISSGSLKFADIVVHPNGQLNFVSGILHDTTSLTLSNGDGLDDARNLISGRHLIVDSTTTVDAATLTIDGGKLTTDSLVTANNGIVTLVTGTVEIVGVNGFTIGSGGGLGEQLFLELGATLHVNETTFIASDGLLRLEDGSLITSQLDNSAGGNFRWNSGSFQLTGGTTSLDLTIPPLGQLIATGSINGKIKGVLGSQIIATGPLSLGNSSLVDGFSIAGDLDVNDQIVTLLDANDAVLTSTSFVSVGGDGPGVLIAANGLTLDFGGNITGFGTVDTPNNSATPLINNGHITGASLGEPVTLTGYVKGVGTQDNVVITGTDAPGFSTARVNRGSVTYDGTLEIEIGGTSPGSGYDQLNHILGAGIVELGGLLDVHLINGFVPSPGDVFEILTASGGINGTFDQELLPDLGSSLAFSVQYELNSISLAVTSILSGDFDFDGDVDGRDFLIWQRGGSPNPLDSSDLDNWKSTYGLSTLSASSAAVPEPNFSTLVLLVVVMILIACARCSEPCFARAAGWVQAPILHLRLKLIWLCLVTSV